MHRAVDRVPATRFDCKIANESVGQRKNLIVWLRAVPLVAGSSGFALKLTCRYSGVASRYGSKCA